MVREARSSPQPSFNRNEINMIQHSDNANSTVLGDQHILGSLTAGSLSVRGANYYEACLSQVATAPPTAVVLNSDFGDSINWARLSAGIYTGTISPAPSLPYGHESLNESAPAFPADRTGVLISPDATNPSALLSGSRTADDVVTVKSWDTTGTPALADGLLKGAMVRIVVGPPA